MQTMMNDLVEHWPVALAIYLLGFCLTLFMTGYADGRRGFNLNSSTRPSGQFFVIIALAIVWPLLWLIALSYGPGNDLGNRHREGR